MSRRWTEADVAHLQRAPLSAAAVSKRESKYRNEKCTWQGLKFDSIKERDDYITFTQQQACGAIRAVIRQMSFPLMGSKRRIRVDHVIVELDGSLKFYDSKGVATPEWLGKRDQVRTQYGIEIQII